VLDIHETNSAQLSTVTCPKPSVPVMFKLVLLHGNTKYIIPIIIQTLMCFDEYSIFMRQEVNTSSICKHRL